MSLPLFMRRDDSGADKRLTTTASRVTRTELADLFRLPVHVTPHAIHAAPQSTHSMDATARSSVQSLSGGCFAGPSQPFFLLVNYVGSVLNLSRNR